MDSDIQIQGNIRPVSMIYMHGDEDPIVPFGGGHVALGPARGGLILSHQSALDAWIAIDHCNPEPIVTDMPDISKDGTTVTRYEYTEGMQGTAVTGYTIHHGGHTWPGGWQYLPPFLVGKTSRDIQASEVIWNFFKEHGR
jgi:polyhydroxybutyrate depolymerase